MWLGKVSPAKQEEYARACKWMKAQVEETDSRENEKLLGDQKPGPLQGQIIAGLNMGLTYGGEWALTNAIRDQRRPHEKHLRN